MEVGLAACKNNCDGAWYQPIVQPTYPVTAAVGVGVLSAGGVMYYYGLDKAMEALIVGGIVSVVTLVGIGGTSCALCYKSESWPKCTGVVTIHMLTEAFGAAAQGFATAIPVVGPLVSALDLNGKMNDFLTGCNGFTLAAFEKQFVEGFDFTVKNGKYVSRTIESAASDGWSTATGWIPGV